MPVMQKITPTLWFDLGKAQEAAEFYTALFPDSRIDSIVRSPADNPSTSEGEVLTVEFTIAGSPFVGLNGGPDFTFNESVSFVIDCKDQAEVDRYWDALVEGGGEHSVCGWLKDRFGLSWQVVPREMHDMLHSTDRDGARRAFEAMLKMQKLDVAMLKEAFEGVPA
jgi:predicted 3-demethylubiquinone-9 3-methyltransferase (glyoxalase superfamily)